MYSYVRLSIIDVQLDVCTIVYTLSVQLDVCTIVYTLSELTCSYERIVTRPS